jgi:hypothetical protein
MKRIVMAIMAVAVAVTFSVPAFADERIAGLVLYSLIDPRPASMLP